MSGIDPDLFFDDDGRVYVANSNFELAEIDLQKGKIIGEEITEVLPLSEDDSLIYLSLPPLD